MKDGMVLELQREALNEDISLENLLLKAYVVARKLKLEEFEKWIEQEQNGYKDKVPDYRNVLGAYKVQTFNGWYPIILPHEIADQEARLPIRYSISTLVEAYKLSKDGSIYSGVSGRLTKHLNELIKNQTYPLIYGFFISTADVYKIFNTVRHQILKWSLLLEEKGILGESFIFTSTEKDIAKDEKIINFTNNFWSNVKTVDLKEQ